jgi:hypothetical protein
VSEVLFGVEKGRETNRGINYQLINSQGITVVERMEEIGGTTTWRAGERGRSCCFMARKHLKNIKKPSKKKKKKNN